MFSCSLIAQRLCRVEAGGAEGREQRPQRAERHRCSDDDEDVRRDDVRRESVEIVELLREQLDMEGFRGEIHNVVAVEDDQHSGQRPGDAADHANQESLEDEDPGDAAVARAERLQNADFAGFLVDRGDQCIHDAERRHQNDEDEQEEHHVLLDREDAEELAVALLPGDDAQMLERRAHILHQFLLVEGVGPPAVKRGGRTPRQAEEFGGVVDAGEEEGAVEIILPHAVDAAHGEFGGEVGGGLFVEFDAAAGLEIDQFGQPLLGVEQYFVAELDPPALRHVAADDDFAAAEGELAFFERVGGEDLVFQQFFGGGAEHDDAGIEEAVDLDEHRRFDDRGRFAACFLDRRDGHIGVVEDAAVVGAHLEMRLRLNELLLHEVGETGHDGEDDDEHGHAEGDAEDAQHRDEGNGAAARLEVAPGQKEFGWHRP